MIQPLQLLDSRSAVRWFVAAATLVVMTVVPRPALAQFGIAQFNIDDDQLISWAFENQSSVNDARQRAEELLNGQIEFVAVIGTLRPDQRQRLELAGQGDISRFFADAETLMRTLPRGNLTQEEWQGVWQKLSPIRERYTQGLNGRESLFQKALRSVLTAEQIDTYREVARQRAQRHYRALVGMAVAEIEIKLPLTIDQRTELVELLMKETDPPRGVVNNYLQTAYVQWQMSKLPEEKLRAIFDEVEWKLMQGMMQQMQGWGGNFRGEDWEADGEEWFVF